MSKKKLQSILPKTNLNKLQIGFFIIVTIWILLYWNFFTLPVLWEEPDYVSFVQYTSLRHLFTPFFFYLADGHPPLLSLPFGILLFKSIPILLLRISIFAYLLIGINFCLKFSQKFQTNDFLTLGIIVYILFSHCHVYLFSSFTGDVGGMLYLFGWVYYRLKNEKLKSLFCLIIALGIRESHFLVPFSFLVTFATLSPKKMKDCWPELLPIAGLIIYYSLSKLLTGNFYNFSSKSYWNLRVFFEEFNLLDFKLALRLIIPFLLSMTLIIYNKNIENQNLFLKKRFYIILISLIFLSLGPYLKINFRPRLYSPFILVFLVPAFLLFKKQKNAYTYFNTFICTIFIAFLFLLDTQLYERDFQIKHSQNAAIITEKVRQLADKTKVNIIISWPYFWYLSEPNFGHISNYLNYYFINDDSIRAKIPIICEEIKMKPFVIIYRDYDKSTTGKYIHELCFKKEICSRFKMTLNHDEIFYISFRNISPEIMKDIFNFKVLSTTNLKPISSKLDYTW